MVIPAKAGIQGAKATAVAPDPRFREGDDTLLIMLVSFRPGLLTAACSTMEKKRWAANGCSWWRSSVVTIF